MPDFLGPAQLMGQQLQGVLQEAANTAADDRAYIAMRHLQMQQTAKQMDVDYMLAKELFKTDKAASLEAMNRFLSPMNRALTLQQYDSAKPMLDLAEQYQAEGKHDEMQLVLKQLDGQLINTGDIERATQLQVRGRQAQAAKQVQDIQALQPDDPGVARAKELVTMGSAIQNQDPLTGQKMLAPGVAEKFQVLTGSDDPAVWRREIAVAQAQMDVEQTRTKALASVFAAAPGAFGKAAEGIAISQVNPQTRADLKIADLLRIPEEERTPQQERQLDSLIFAWKPQLYAQWSEKSATNKKLELADERNDNAQRIGNIDQTLGLFHEGTTSVSQLQNAGTTTDGNLTNQQAKDALLVEGTLDAKHQLFMKQNADTVTRLQGMATDAQDHAASIEKRMLIAPFERKEKLRKQRKEYQAIEEAYRAQARLLQEESPYAIAKRESDVALMDDGPAKYREMKAIEETKAARDKDLKLMEGERARLVNRQAVLDSLMTDAERKEQAEQTMAAGVRAVPELLRKNVRYSQAITDVSKELKIDPAELNKRVQSMQSPTLFDAQMDFAALPTEQQTPQQAAKIARRYQKDTGISLSPEKIMEGVKLPNAPLVQVGITQEKAEAAKVGAGFGEMFVEMQKADLQSTQQLAKLDRMEQLLAGVATGKLTPAMTDLQAIAQSFNITLDPTLPAKQAFTALANEIALTLRNPSGGAGMPGALSDKDREFLQSMTPSLANTPRGNRIIIETGRQLARRSHEVAQLAAAYRTKHGQFDQGFFRELQAYSMAHPLFQPPDLSQFTEIRETPDGRRIGRKKDGTLEEIKF